MFQADVSAGHLSMSAADASGCSAQAGKHANFYFVTAQTRRTGREEQCRKITS